MPTGIYARKSMLERFWSKVDKSAGPDGCWLWTGAQSHGYGRFVETTTPMKKTQNAHRMSWIIANGSVRDGMVIDHLCRNPSCVNLLHLEAVTNRENVQRGLKGVLTTHCPRGHEYDDANTLRNRHGHRNCKECKNAQRRATYNSRSHGSQGDNNV